MSMDQVIRSLLVICVVILGAAISHAADAEQGSPQVVSLNCKKYDTNTFLSDSSVTQTLLTPAAAGRQPLLPPCTEAVSGSPVVRDSNPTAAAHELNTLFDATRTPLERFQNGFDLYSWVTFVALNSPADPAAPFGTPEARTVWETFLPLDQVIKFHDDRENFNLNNPPQACRDLKATPAPTLFVSVDEVAFNQPFKTGPLIDQNGNYSLNTIFVNQAMREFIVANGLQTFHGQEVFPAPIDFPAGESRNRLALGSIMIKASWRLLTAADDPNEFHTVKAYRFSPAAGPLPETCEVRTLGLVGLHVVHKTEDRHQWVWTTFEHVRNVPSLEDLRRGTLQKSYFFFDLQRKTAPCSLNDSLTGCRPGEARNRTPDHPWDPRTPSARKSQIVRAQDISADARTINEAAHQFFDSTKATQVFAKGNVWRHYQLISTQWPADFECSSEGNLTKPKVVTKTDQQADPNCSPAPEFLPNSTLETYIQHDIGSNGGVPQSTSSCIACHNNAVAYQHIDFGDKNNLAHGGAPSPAETTCRNNRSPTLACSSASDFTFILEQVCAPMPDLETGKPDAGICKRDH